MAIAMGLITDGKKMSARKNFLPRIFPDKIADNKKEILKIIAPAERSEEQKYSLQLSYYTEALEAALESRSVKSR